VCYGASPPFWWRPGFVMLQWPMAVLFVRIAGSHGGHQGDSGGQASGDGAAHGRGRRAVFDANNSNWEAKVVHWQFSQTQARHTDVNFFVDPGRPCMGVRLKNRK